MGLTSFGTNSDRQIRSVTGLSFEALNYLLPFFILGLENAQQATFEVQKANGTRKRAIGGGRKGALHTPALKLVFILCYLKNYPTFDKLGYDFGLTGGKAEKNVKRLLPILYQVLADLGYLPKRSFNNVAELVAAFKDKGQLLVDVTERATQRPKDPIEQKLKYSGKKKRHTIKNTVITTISKTILFLGKTTHGSQHDFAMFKSEFPTEQEWFACFELLVDLGYLGIEKNYNSLKVLIPYKKPRKSKNNPNPQLTDEQREYNKQVSKIRILVEHAIGGMKKFNILVHRFRNRVDQMADLAIELAAGLWNLQLDINK